MLKWFVYLTGCTQIVESVVANVSEFANVSVWTDEFTDVHDWSDKLADVRDCRNKRHRGVDGLRLGGCVVETVKSTFSQTSESCVCCRSSGELHLYHSLALVLH